MTEAYRKIYQCPLEVTVKAISGKWKCVILWHLRMGKLRFGQLRNCLPGITNKILSKQLKDLEEKNLVCREVFASIPLRVEYSLTETGKAVVPILKSMYEIGLKYSNRFKRK